MLQVLPSLAGTRQLRLGCCYCGIYLLSVLPVHLFSCFPTWILVQLDLLEHVDCSPLVGLLIWLLLNT